ncbi:MAG: DUF488 family protein [bacterium]|nr:DUF488 family protein [bacterium]
MPGNINVHMARLYHSPFLHGSYRVLVESLWPKSIKKSDLEFDEWDKEIPPSTKRWKHSDREAEWLKEFAKQYEEELKFKTAQLNRIIEIAKEKEVTLLYTAMDLEINYTVILKKYY